MSDWRSQWKGSVLDDALWFAIGDLPRQEDPLSEAKLRAVRKKENAVDDAVQALMAQVEEDTIEACAKIADEQARIAGEKLKAAISKGDVEYEGFRGMGIAAYDIARLIRSRLKETP